MRIIWLWKIIYTDKRLSSLGAGEAGLAVGRDKLEFQVAKLGEESGWPWLKEMRLFC